MGVGATSQVQNFREGYLFIVYPHEILMQLMIYKMASSAIALTQ